MSDYICPYNCSYRTNSGYCGYTGGREACQFLNALEASKINTNSNNRLPEVKLVIGAYDILYAAMPDGTYREVLVDVQGVPYYGIIGIGSPARKDQLGESFSET